MSIVSLPAAVPLFLVGISSTFAADSPPVRVPSRIAKEAETLQQNGTRILTRETLAQRSLVPPGARLRIRDVVSEFSFGTRRGSLSHHLPEFRRVLSVDGTPIQSVDTARRALSEGDDRARKRMLQEAARTGLADIATDYSLILQEFTAADQEQMDISPSASCDIGTDPALAFLWKQRSAESRLTEFHGRESVHRPLQGTLWVRASDGLPLRINAWMEYDDQDGNRIRADASVDYVLSQLRFLTPASVIHHHLVNGSLVIENLYLYEPFQFFSASSNISFGSPK